MQDPRERPLAAQQRADEAHRQVPRRGQRLRRLAQALGVLAGRARAQLVARSATKLCRDNFLSYNRMREWDDIHAQLVRVMRELGFAPNDAAGVGRAAPPRAAARACSARSACGTPRRAIYIGARQTRFLLHPSSALAQQAAAWVMAAELVETSQLFARTVAKIDPAWLEQAGGAAVQAQLRRSALGAEAPAQVDGEGAGHALRPADRQGPQRRLRGRSIRRCAASCSSRTRWCATSTRRKARVHGAQPRAARRGRSGCATRRAAATCSPTRTRSRDFFEERVPDDVVSGKTFEAWRERPRREDPRVLVPLARGRPARRGARALARALPRRSSWSAARRCRCRTGSIRARTTTASRSPCRSRCCRSSIPAVLEWTIPGWHRGQDRARCSTRCPRRCASSSAPLDELARRARRRSCGRSRARCCPRSSARSSSAPASACRATRGTCARCRRTCGFGFRVVDEHDKAARRRSRSRRAAARARPARARAVGPRAARAKHERTGLTTWDFESLPASVNVDVGGRKLLAYPALVDDRDGRRRAPARVAGCRRGRVARRPAPAVHVERGLKMSVLEGQLPLSLGAHRESARAARARRSVRRCRRCRPVARRLPIASRRAARASPTRSAISFGSRSISIAELDRARALIKPLLQRPGADARGARRHPDAAATARSRRSHAHDPARAARSHHALHQGDRSRDCIDSATTCRRISRRPRR